MITQAKEIIKKNFILLWRSKNTVITIFFGPLILIFLLGLAFNNNELGNISIASYSERYNDLSNSLLNGFEKKDFNVIKTVSELECINSVKLGKNHLCIIMPADFGVTKNNELIVYIDQSKVNLVENIMNLLSEDIHEKTSKISLDLTSILLDKLEEVRLLNSNSSAVIYELKIINQNSNLIIDNTIINLNQLSLEL